MSTKAGESLKNYNGVITAGNNGTKPTGNPYDYSNWRNDTTSTSIYSNSPKVNWNSPTVYDRITNGNLGCGALTTTANCNNSGSSIDFWTGLAMACTGLPAVMSLAQGVAGLFNKGDKQNAYTDTNLTSIMDEIDNMSKEEIQNKGNDMLSNLVTRRNTAQSRLDNAKRDKETARKTVSNLDSEKVKLEKNSGDYAKKISAKTTELSSENRKLSDLRLQLSTATEETKPKKSELQTQINTLEENIKTLEKDIKKLEEDKLKTDEAIVKIQNSIDEENLKIKQFDEIIESLPDEIKDADKAIKKLDKKVTDAEYELGTDQMWQKKQ